MMLQHVLYGHSYFKDTIHELLSQRTNIIATQERVTEDPADEYHQEKFATIPKLGTRVRRGPHWTFANQDSEGAGTIVGHGDLGSCSKLIRDMYAIVLIIDLCIKKNIQIYFTG